MEFPTRAGPKPCPVEGCSGWALTRTAMRVHFWYRHVRDTVVILEQGNLTYPRCPLCDMLVPWKAQNGTHMRTEQCTWGAVRRRRQLAAEEEREVTARNFSAYGRPLEMVTSFKYLGRVILESDNDCVAVVRNLDRVKTVWRKMSHILSKDRATPWASRLFLKAVIQVVLLFEAETWVVAPHTGKALGEFQTQVTRQLAGKLPRRTTDRTRKYTSVAAPRGVAGFFTME